MATETERKFLVDFDLFKKIYPDKEKIRQINIEQYYVYVSKEISLRMRKEGPDFFSVAKYNSKGISCTEITMRISASDYSNNKDLRVGRTIHKTRYKVEHYGNLWEVDVFGGELEELVLAEYEHPKAADLTRDFMPMWVGAEVTHNPMFKNAVLATSDEWKKEIAIKTGFRQALNNVAAEVTNEDIFSIRMCAQNILILENKDSYRKLSIDDVMSKDFIAYKVGPNYVVTKNKLDGMLGLMKSYELEKYLQRY